MVVENYRLAHEIALRDRRGEAETEDLKGDGSLPGIVRGFWRVAPLQPGRVAIFKEPERIYDENPSAKNVDADLGLTAPTGESGRPN
jgi:hypothetical protein